MKEEFVVVATTDLEVLRTPIVEGRDKCAFTFSSFSQENFAFVGRQWGKRVDEMSSGKGVMHCRHQDGEM